MYSIPNQILKPGNFYLKVYILFKNTGKNVVQQESTPSVKADGNLEASSSTSNIGLHTIPHIQQQQRIVRQFINFLHLRNVL